jgi:hypothetical protein
MRPNEQRAVTTFRNSYPQVTSWLPIKIGLQPFIYLYKTRFIYIEVTKVTRNTYICIKRYKKRPLPRGRYGCLSLYNCRCFRVTGYLWSFLGIALRASKAVAVTRPVTAGLPVSNRYHEPQCFRGFQGIDPRLPAKGNSSGNRLLGNLRKTTRCKAPSRFKPSLPGNHHPPEQPVTASSLPTFAGPSTAIAASYPCAVTSGDCAGRSTQARGGYGRGAAPIAGIGGGTGEVPASRGLGPRRWRSPINK